MDSLKRTLMSVEEIRWVLDVALGSFDQSEVEFERMRLRELLQRAEEVGSGAPISIFHLDEIQSEFLDIMDSHPILRLAYLAMVSRDMIGIALKGLAYLSTLERSRPLTETELRRRNSAEETLLSCRNDLGNYLRQIREPEQWT